MQSLMLGVDTGGTFTDFVLFDGKKLKVHKVLSTPEAPEKAILQGIRELGIGKEGLRLVHGSTVATNAVLEGKGVQLAYITNKGMADVLAIGRQARQELYNLNPDHRVFPLQRKQCIELDVRMDAQGQILKPLTEAMLSTLMEQLKAMSIDAVAINLLHAYKDGSMEQRIKARLGDDWFVSVSSEILPEIKEYERGMATWLNAWIGPKVEGYLQRLRKALPSTKLSIMQSSADTISAQQAAHHAVRLLLSGPAGGLMGASFMAKQAVGSQLLTFDMGGTSTDVALIQGQPRLTSEGQINGWPVAVPMVDMHTIGAGGGSIAWLDEGGLLNVGPQSAGASPGPACYGKGGQLATVTDANLVLGRLLPSAFLGGQLCLDKQAATAVIAGLSESLGLSIQATAKGIIQIANEHMVQALRVISIQRGMNPQNFVLTSFGGAGGLHVCALANALGIKKALVPLHAGVLSAFGMLVTPAGRQVSRTHLYLLEEQNETELQQALDNLSNEALIELQAEGLTLDELHITYTLALRYEGQSSTLDIMWKSWTEIANDFHFQHKKSYGHALDLPIEIVHIRAALRQHAVALSWGQSVDSGLIDNTESLSGLAVYPRDSLRVGQVLHAPALIVEQVATTWLADGWTAKVDEHGHLLLSVVDTNG